MAAGRTYDDVPLRVVRDEEQGGYLFQAVLDGVPVTFAGRKLGGIDDDLRRAAEAAAEAAANPAQPQTPPPTTG
jgi:hypothetical protein